MHATTEAEDKVEGGLLLDVVISQGPAILELLAGKDEPLLVRGNALLILNLGLDIVDGVRTLHLEGDGLASQGLDKDLHATTKAKYEVEGGLLLDVVIRKGPAILKLLTGKDQPLLVWRDSLFVLDLSLDIVDGVRGFNLKGDGLASESFNKDLHLIKEIKEERSQKTTIRSNTQKRTSGLTTIDQI